jgi:hypothetical protein
MRLMSSLALGFTLFLAPQTPPASVWPPAGVITERDGLTLPVLERRVDPVYTREAMRARIQDS